MIKRAYAVQMSYEVSDAEKHQAERAILFFNHTMKKLRDASEYLDLLKTPFKDKEESPDKIFEARAAVRRFRDKSVNMFNEFKESSFKCVQIMQEFSSDTQAVKLMKLFINSINDLEGKVNDFTELFSDLKSVSFSKDIVESIESIQEDCEAVKSLYEERIRDHIQTNILAKSWVDNISEELQAPLTKKTPLIMDLFNKRQDELNDLAKTKT